MYKIPGKQIVLDVDPQLGSNSDLIISSQKAVKSYVDSAVGGAVSKVVQTISGNDTDTIFNITHNLNSYDVFVQVYSNAPDRENISPVIYRTDVNTVQIQFALAPSLTESFRVIVI